MKHEKVIDKIKKCLALAQSSNANEAAAAMRQAQALMKKYNVNQDQVELADVTTASGRANNAQKPTRYSALLVKLIQNAFGVDAVYSTVTSFGKTTATVEFIGIGAQPEIAAYAYDVLRRQLNKDRQAYLKTLKRFKPANKTRKANAFAEGWVFSLHDRVHHFARPEKHSQLIEKYKAQTYGGKLGEVESRKNSYRSEDGNAWNQGSKAGDKANLHHATKADQRAAIGN